MSTAARLVGLATVLLTLVFCAPASAAIFVVEDGGDGGDVNPGDEVCSVTNSPDPPICTLRAAIEEANALDGPDVVDLAVEDVGLLLALGGAIEISSEVTILGDEEGTTGVRQEVPFSPDGGDRVFDIQAGADVTLRNLTVHQGEANPTNGFFGGNIRSAGTLFIEDSTITAGSGYSAGGIANTGGTLTLVRSTVSGNTALNGGGDAGAILNFGTESPATTQITNSTISGNQARLGGGVFSYNHPGNSVSISNSTIAFNESGDRGLGGGLAIGSGTAAVDSSIIAKNTSASPDNQNCSGSINSSGFNLEDHADCGFTATGDDQNSDPLLDDLDPNGGPTLTHALLEESPAVDAGPVECPADDQRGVSRPQGPRCDKGAFELEAADFRAISSAGPLEQIWLGDDLNCQVHYVGDAQNAFFGERRGSCGTFLVVNGQHAGNQRVEQSDVTGDGTRDDPFQVVTRVAAMVIEGEAEAFAIDVTRTDTYVEGEDFYRSEVTVQNPTDMDVSALLFHAADCFLQDNDNGFGYHDDASGGIFCAVNKNNSPPGRVEGFVPLSDGAQWFAGDLEQVFNPPGDGYPNLCCIESEPFDNGMGISWDFALPAGKSETRSFLTAFSVADEGEDTTPPETTIDSGPTGPTADSTPTFNFSSDEAGSTFQCSVDGAAFTGCNSPHTTAALSDGAHTFAVRAIDAVGNVDPTPDQNAFSVDTAAPQTTIDSGPSGPTADSTPTFGFSSSEPGSTFQCSVDGGAFTACTSLHTTAALADGAHTFAVRARDALGNTDASPAQRALTVDTAAPNTAIDSGPNEPSTDSTPTFVFSAAETGSQFECSVDGGPFGPCSSPFTTGDLPAGKHTLAVRAVDPAGNADPSPSVFEFVVQAETVEQLPDPKPGETINVQEVAGTVLIGIPSSAAAAQSGRSGRASQKGITFVPLTAAEQIPVGSFLDTTRGTVRLQSATNAAGDRQTGDFLSAIFQVRQSKSRSARGLTDLVLKGGSFNRCRAARGKRAGASQSRTVRRLRSNARGRFRTSGRNSSATVRGTRWETIDRCDGTLTKVQRGSVVVRDFRKKKNVVVKAGKSYLARARG